MWNAPASPPSVDAEAPGDDVTPFPWTAPTELLELLPRPTWTAPVESWAVFSPPSPVPVGAVTEASAEVTDAAGVVSVPTVTVSSDGAAVAVGATAASPT